MDTNEQLEAVRGEVRRGRVIWGAVFIALGVVLLLDRFGPWQMPHIAQLWPVIVLVFAFVRLLDGRPGGALMLAGLGAWFLAVEFGWFGFTWGTSWPLALVAVGIGIVVRALTGEDRRRLRRLGVRLD